MFVIRVCFEEYALLVNTCTKLLHLLTTHKHTHTRGYIYIHVMTLVRVYTQIDVRVRKRVFESVFAHDDRAERAQRGEYLSVFAY